MKDQKGFTHLGILLLVLVVAVIGGVGYYVYSKQDDSSTNQTTGNNQSQITSRDRTLAENEFCMPEIKACINWDTTKWNKEVGTYTADDGKTYESRVVTYNGKLTPRIIFYGKYTIDCSEQRTILSVNKTSAGDYSVVKEIAEYAPRDDSNTDHAIDFYVASDKNISDNDLKVGKISKAECPVNGKYGSLISYPNDQWIPLESAEHFIGKKAAMDWASSAEANDVEAVLKTLTVQK